jgi:CRISPR-associated endoribonuclease Cas6
MYTLSLEIEPLTPKILFSGTHYRRLHAFVLRSIQYSDPDLSEAIHSRTDRQIFSISYWKEKITIHTPSKQLVSTLQQTFLEQDQVDLQDWKARIQKIDASYTSQEDIKNAFSSNFTLRFVTPTTFYQYGNYYPLPELHRLLASAGKVMMLAEGTEVSKQQLETWARNIRIEHAEIKTKRLSFEKFNIIGFCGTLSLQIKSLPIEDQLQVWQLVNYGVMMGFGYKTAWGLGKTQLISKS